MKETKASGALRLLVLVLVSPVAFLASSAPSGGLFAQEFTLRTRVDLVEVPFSVMDGDRFVAGLTPEDFEVREDGRTQTIEEFNVDPVPLSAVLLIDSGLVSASFDALSASREALIKAFNLTPQHRALGTADELAVYRYNNQVTQLLDFTDNEDAFRASLEWTSDFGGGVGTVGGQSPIQSPVINGVPVNPTAPRPETRDQRVLHDAMYEAALALRPRDAERRKIILVVSDGSERDSDTSYEDVQLRLLETGVQVYAVHIRVGLLSRVLGGVTTRLDDYASFTGGSVYGTGPSNLDPLYARITGQARSQYVLYYRSTNEAPADRLVFREIDVRSLEGYDVFHRAGYYQVPE